MVKSVHTCGKRGHEVGSVTPRIRVSICLKSANVAGGGPKSGTRIVQFVIQPTNVQTIGAGKITWTQIGSMHVRSGSSCL